MIRITRTAFFWAPAPGVIFVSDDGGHNWSRFAKLGAGDDYVLDHIAIDPQNSKTIFVSAWSVQDQNAGDIFRTHNGGKDWEALPAMHGKSVRAMAISASDPKVVVAGALDGVYRSTRRRQRLAADFSSDGIVKNIESIAVDPKDPNVVYAGTWHLAWKTSDGGANWQHINKGMIDDSDVFSIIVSSANPSEVFASACSGIYKSTSGGDQFEKIQGHSLHRAAYSRAEAGSQQSGHRLCRNHRGSVEERRRRQDLEAHEQS